MINIPLGALMFYLKGKIVNNTVDKLKEKAEKIKEDNSNDNIETIEDDVEKSRRRL